MTRDCWDCGWHETRQLRIELVGTTTGDETAVKRAALIGEITDELEEIDQVATLEELLTEARRQRRADPVTTDTDGNATE